MNLPELTAVLTAAAALDRRMAQPAADPEGFALMVRTWHSVIGKHTAADALDAVRAHYAVDTRPLLPADITRHVHDVRARRLQGIDVAEGMDHLADRPGEWVAEMQRRREAVAAGTVDRAAITSRA